MVKFLIFLALGLAAAEKLDRTYLPPPGSKFAGGSAQDLQVPLEPPKETFSTTLGPQTGRIDGLPTLGDSQIELGISRGIPSGPSQDLGISTSGTNSPFTYFQNTYNIPTTTTSYAFSQTTTLPPGQVYDIANGSLNPTTGLSSLIPAEIIQTTVRPYPPEQYNQNTVDYMQYSAQSTPRPEFVSPGSNPPSGYVYSTPREQLANNNLPTYAPGTQFQSFNQYEEQQPISNASPGNSIHAPGFVQAYNQQNLVQYPYGQQPIRIGQQAILPSVASPTSPQSTSNIVLGNAGQIPGYPQSYNQQDLTIEYPNGLRPFKTSQDNIPSTVAPTGAVQGPRYGTFNEQIISQYPQDQGSFNIGEQRFLPSTATPIGKSGTQSRVTSQYGNNFNRAQPFGPNGGNTQQSGFQDRDMTNFMLEGNIQSNQPTYGQNIDPLNKQGSISLQYPSISGSLGDTNTFNKDQNIYNNGPNFSGIPNSTPDFKAGTSYPGEVFSSTSTISPIFPNQDPTSVRYKIRPERPQAESDRNAVILNYENVRTPEGYSYSFDTSNNIHADESGTTFDGTKAQGSYSYIGDDGKLYSVTYTADENGFQPRGDHLPTSPPIPEAIQRVIDQAARDRAAGISDDGSYDEAKYGHKKYEGNHHSHDQKGIFNNGADLPDMNENQFSAMKIKQFRPQGNQIRPVSTTQEYETNDYDDGQDYKNTQPSKINHLIEDDIVDGLQENILTQGGRTEIDNRPSKYPGSQKIGNDFANNPEGFDETSSQIFSNGRSDNPSKTVNGDNKYKFSDASQMPGITNIQQSKLSRPGESNQFESTTRYNKNRKLQPSGDLNDNTNSFDGRQTKIPSNSGNKNNQLSLNPRTEFTALKPINEETGYQYSRPDNSFSEDGNRFPLRFKETNKASSTRKPPLSSSSTAKPFITPNIYRNDDETLDETDDQQTSTPQNSIYPTSGISSQYDEKRRPGYYRQSSKPDQIIGDDEISYSTVSTPIKSKTSSTRGPFNNAPTTIEPFNRYTTSNQGTFDMGRPLNQKETLSPGQKGGNRYPSSTSFNTRAPGFVSSTTPMPSTFTSTLTPQRTLAKNRYQTTYNPTASPIFTDKPMSPGFSSSIRSGTSGRPSRPFGSTQGLTSTTFRPSYNVGDETLNKLSPDFNVDGFGRPIEQYNQFSDGTANPSISTDNRLENISNPGLTRPSGNVRGNKIPGLNVDTKSTRPVPEYNQSTERVLGEDFSGPKRPQTFDPETGYHNK